MILPFDLSNAFKVSNSLNAFVKDDIVIIDNFYENYDTLYGILTNMAIPNFKSILNENNLNFKNYYDCRSIIQHRWSERQSNDTKETILKIAKDIFKYDYVCESKDYDFNYFKHINLPKNNDIQMEPHIDSDIGAIIYLDKISSGGTALYPTLNSPLDNKHVNLMLNVNGIEKNIIPAKPNRLVLFPAQQYHGGYIEDHSKYLNDWRINQVFFLYKKELDYEK